MHHKDLKKLANIKSPHPWTDQGVALLLMITLIVIELKTSQSVSFLMSVLCFGYFSSRMRPLQVAGWAVVFSIIRFYFLLQPHKPGVPVDMLNAYVRFGAMLIIGVGAALLSDKRIRLAESFQQTVNILEKLPVPVVVSDSHGCIIFMNKDALALLDTTADEVRGASYFSFVVGEEKGRTVQKYFDFVDSKEPILDDMVIQVKKPHPRKVHATIAAIEGREKLLATVISPHLPDAEVSA